MNNSEKIIGEEIIVNGETIKLYLSYYPDIKKRMEIYGEDELCLPYANLTINIPEVPLEENEIIVKTWSENKEFAKAALESGLFIDTGKRVPTGFVQAEIWRIV